MKLHEDRYAFLTIINLIHDVSGIRSDILEKDYYVSLLLRELAEKQSQLPAYFKGGTALYKAQKSISKLAIGIPSTNQQIHTDRPPLNCRDLLQKTA